MNVNRMRPRDAATLIVLDRSNGELRVLMGRRSNKHVFEPGKFVFPGGRTDATDSRVKLAADLPAAEVSRIAGHHARATAARARGIALSAVRETYEEAGVLIGRREAFKTRIKGWQGFVEHNITPSLDGLRLVARAITPTGEVRRYDTRFFATWISNIGSVLPEGGPSKELEELCWPTVTEAKRLHVPIITSVILDDLVNRLREDRELSPGWQVPIYRFARNRMIRDMF